MINIPIIFCHILMHLKVTLIQSKNLLRAKLLRDNIRQNDRFDKVQASSVKIINGITAK